MRAIGTGPGATEGADLRIPSLDRLPPGAFHQYVPVDRPLWVIRFLDHWRPDLVLWTESELWPNLLSAIRRRR